MEELAGIDAGILLQVARYRGRGGPTTARGGNCSQGWGNGATVPSFNWDALMVHTTLPSDPPRSRSASTGPAGDQKGA